MSLIQITIDGKEEDMSKSKKRFEKVGKGDATISVFDEGGQLVIMREGLDIDEAKRLARSLDRADVGVRLKVTILYDLK